MKIMLNDPDFKVLRYHKLGYLRTLLKRVELCRKLWDDNGIYNLAIEIVRQCEQMSAKDFERIKDVYEYYKWITKQK